MSFPFFHIQLPENREESNFNVSNLDCYYNKIIDEEGAANLLKSLPNGAFLLRPGDGSQTKACIISIKLNQSTVTHGFLPQKCIDSQVLLESAITQVSRLLPEIRLTPISEILRPVSSSVLNFTSNYR